MIPYFLLLLIPAIFCFTAVRKTKFGHMLCVGNNEFIKRHNLAIIVFFFLLFVLLSLRGIMVGRDQYYYKQVFTSYIGQPAPSFEIFQTENLFDLLNWLIAKITRHYQIFASIVAALTLIPMVLLYNEEKRYAYLKIVLFVNMSTFVMIFSGIRQALAMATGMIAYRFVRKKQWLAFLVVVIVALGFHHSAFMLLFMYPLYHVSFKKKHLFLIVPAVGVTFLLNQQIFGILNRLLASYMDEYAMEVTSSSAITMIILFVLFGAFCYLLPDEEQLDRETIGLRNFLVFAIFLQCFAPVHPLAMRMNYYFILFIPLLLPKVLEKTAPRFRQVAKLGEVVLSVFFTAYFVYTVYIGSTTGVSALGVYPYVPFWN